MSDKSSVPNVTAKRDPKEYARLLSIESSLSISLVFYMCSRTKCILTLSLCIKVASPDRQHAATEWPVHSGRERQKLHIGKEGRREERKWSFGFDRCPFSVLFKLQELCVRD